jgi:hypothetical protein
MSQPLRVAAFELIISGRFWVIAKVLSSGGWTFFCLQRSPRRCNHCYRQRTLVWFVETGRHSPFVGVIDTDYRQLSSSLQTTDHKHECIFNRFRLRGIWPLLHLRYLTEMGIPLRSWRLRNRREVHVSLSQAKTGLTIRVMAFSHLTHLERNLTPTLRRHGRMTGLWTG